MSAHGSGTAVQSPVPVGVTLDLTPVPGLAAATHAAGLQFTKLAPIGVGEGQHEVFVGRDHQIEDDLVYKRIPKSKFSSPGEFFAEARRLHESRHRHVVPITYACEDNDSVFLAMPYFRSGSLKALLDRRCLTAREIVRLGLDFLMGLHHAHVRGIAHFDIKPTNVFLDASGAALLADFGQSRIVGPTGFVKMPGMYDMHLPPEAVSYDQLTKQADVYQAGLTLYRMALGRAAWEREIAPFGGKATSRFGDALSKGKFPSRESFPEHVPTRLRTLIEKALAADPDRRWRTVLDLMNQLATVDGALDWRPIEDPSGGMAWERILEQAGKRVELIPEKGGLTWRVEASRFGAKPVRLKKDCLDPSSEAVARKHARKLLSA